MVSRSFRLLKIGEGSEKALLAAVARSSVLVPLQIVDQRFCHYEIGRLEPLGETTINRSK
jgi:hypothetical protein